MRCCCCCLGPRPVSRGCTLQDRLSGSSPCPRPLLPRQPLPPPPPPPLNPPLLRPLSPHQFRRRLLRLRLRPRQQLLLSPTTLATVAAPATDRAAKLPVAPPPTTFVPPAAAPRDPLDSSPSRSGTDAVRRTCPRGEREEEGKESRCSSSQFPSPARRITDRGCLSWPERRRR